MKLFSFEGTELENNGIYFQRYILTSAGFPILRSGFLDLWYYKCRPTAVFIHSSIDISVPIPSSPLGRLHSKQDICLNAILYLHRSFRYCPCNVYQAKKKRRKLAAGLHAHRKRQTMDPEAKSQLYDYTIILENNVNEKGVGIGLIAMLVYIVEIDYYNTLSG